MAEISSADLTEVLFFILVTQPLPPSSNADVTASLVYAFAPICLLALLIIIFYWIYRRYKLRRTVKRLARNGHAGGLTLPFKIPPSPTDGSKAIELIEVHFSFFFHHRMVLIWFLF